MLTGDRNVVGLEHVDDAAGRARHRGVLAHDQATEVDRVQSVGVLCGVDAHERRAVVEPRRERVLHDERIDGGVGVQLVDGRLDVGLGGVVRQTAVDRGHADLCAVRVLHRDVLRTRPVVADEDRSEARSDATLGQRRDAVGHVVLERRGQGVSVERDRSHGSRLRRPPDPVPRPGCAVRRRQVHAVRPLSHRWQRAECTTRIGWAPCAFQRAPCPRESSCALCAPPVGPAAGNAPR